MRLGHVGSFTLKDLQDPAAAAAASAAARAHGCPSAMMLDLMEQAEAAYEERIRGDVRHNELVPRTPDDMKRRSAPSNEHRAHVVARLATELSKNLTLKATGVAEAAELTERGIFERTRSVTRYQSAAGNAIATAGHVGSVEQLLRIALGEELPSAPDLKMAGVSGLQGVAIKATYT